VLDPLPRSHGDCHDLDDSTACSPTTWQPRIVAVLG